jgi:hypothetical protein
VEHKQQYVGIDLHRRRSVIVRMAEDGEVLSAVQIDNDPVAMVRGDCGGGPGPGGGSGEHLRLVLGGRSAPS